MVAYQHSSLQTETKRKMSEAAEKLLQAHYDLIDPKGVIFKRVSNGVFLVRTEAATFQITVSTKIS